MASARQIAEEIARAFNRPATKWGVPVPDRPIRGTAPRGTAGLYDSTYSKLLDQEVALRDDIRAAVNGISPASTTPNIVVELPDAVGTPRQVLAAQAAPMYGRNVATALENMPAESTIMSPAFLDGLLFEIDAAKGAPILLENGDPRLTAVGMKVAQSSDPMQSILALTKQDWSTADLSEGGQQYLKNLRAGNQSPVVVEPTVEVVSEAPSTPPVAVVTSPKNVGSMGGGEGFTPKLVEPLIPNAPANDMGAYLLGGGAAPYSQSPSIASRRFSVLTPSSADIPEGGIDSVQLALENRAIGYMPTASVVDEDILSTLSPVPSVAPTPPSAVDAVKVEADTRPWWQKKRYIIPAAAGGLYAGATLMGNSEPEEQYYQPSPYGQMPQSFY